MIDFENPNEILLHDEITKLVKSYLEIKNADILIKINGIIGYLAKPYVCGVSGNLFRSK